ncbi:excalibur calcium-binding domain-containing protein [Streptomyces sp. ActVer]|uniref:LAETG motif-containing sortase-dependent surface protein n=1 Tax=Streptomyces sp. ActVer TaxID=3014558 RepID=UPI0022B403BC|nr:LAETG motif-containing sortase-dependent surface protein [Streptomyces sp. ActVer]MCZ4512107.1 excalibur calcium-binding domain-containing protein [Streptomyces sp. ActVer]
MKLLRKPAAVAVAALALTALSATTAQAHDGNHPFKNCTEAYENGFSDIPRSDTQHYANDLDRDQDGIGCDQPPSDFVPAEDQGKDDNGTEDTASDTGEKNTDLAETGGSGATAYIAGGGAAVLLAGGGVLFTVRRRANSR